MMSGNDCWNKNVFSRWRKVAIYDDDWTWTSSVPDDCGCNRKRATANGCQTVQRNEQLECRWRPETATTWQLWYWNELIQIRRRQTMLCTHDMPSAQVWNSPVPGDVASVISWGHQWRGRSDEVEIPNELQRWERLGVPEAKLQPSWFWRLSI